MFLFPCDSELEYVNVISHWPMGDNMLVFSYQNNEIWERGGNEINFSIKHNSLAVYQVISESSENVKLVAITKISINVNVMKRTKWLHVSTINAHIQRVECGVYSGSIGVASWSYQSTPESPINSETQVDLNFRIYDLQLNLLKIVNLISIVPRFEFWVDGFWIDKDFFFLFFFLLFFLLTKIVFWAEP